MHRRPRVTGSLTLLLWALLLVCHAGICVHLAWSHPSFCAIEIEHNEPDHAAHHGEGQEAGDHDHDLGRHHPVPAPRSHGWTAPVSVHLPTMDPLPSHPDDGRTTIRPSCTHLSLQSPLARTVVLLI